LLKITQKLIVFKSRFGIILGPILSGYILDKTRKSYKSIFLLAAAYYTFAFIMYMLMKILLIKNKKNNEKENLAKTEYTQFENETERD